MAEGDFYFDCPKSGNSMEDAWRRMVRLDADDNPCLNVCGDTSGGAGGGVEGDPGVDQFTDATGTITGVKSVTFIWDGEAEIDGVLLDSDDVGGSISFSDANGLGDMVWDVRDVTLPGPANTITILTIT